MNQNYSKYKKRAKKKNPRKQRKIAWMREINKKNIHILYLNMSARGPTNKKLFWCGLISHCMKIHVLLVHKSSAILSKKQYLYIL